MMLHYQKEEVPKSAAVYLLYLLRPLPLLPELEVGCFRTKEHFETRCNEAVAGLGVYRIFERKKYNDKDNT
ncbi:hypothetical protein C0J52_17197 [Blattella germanica]|nr:hypothetical protein C0J52_17197 [Blattella germanica]